MIKFYYSGASRFEAPQTNPMLSLGGYKSSTPIPNDEMNSILSEVSLLAAKNKYRETKLIVLKNELNSLNNVKLWANYPIDIIEPMTNDNNEIFFESIANSYAAPYYANFRDSNIDNPFNLGNLAINKCFGIWIKRVASKELMEPLTITIDYGT